MYQYIPIVPIGKPRMTRQTSRMMAQKSPPRNEKYLATWVRMKRWKAYVDELRLRSPALREFGSHIVFVLPMPKSWSKAKKAAHRGQPHLAKPDKDNLEKGLLDALMTEDSGVWDGRVTKIWHDRGAILIRHNAYEVDIEPILAYIPDAQ